MKLLLFAAGIAAALHGNAQNSVGPKPVSKAASFSLKYEKFVLPNGLKVILHEDHSDPIVAVSTIVHVGSNREKPGKTGFAHFFEHMSFNHSENTPVGANRKLIPEWGGDRNGGTWSDGTVYYEVIPKDAFEKILWIDSDRLGYMINTVTKEALAKEIQVVKNEKRQNYDNVPYGSTNEVILSNLYTKDHPYNWTVIGSLPDLQAATLEDVKEFYNQYYGAANATLVIAGDIDVAKTKERVKLWFGEIRRGPEVKPLKPMSAKLISSRSLYWEDNFAKLPELSMVFPTAEQYHADSYALDILADILAGSKSSPLYKVIVNEKQLAPNVGASQQSKEMAGEFYLRVRANADTKLDDVKAAIEEGFNRFEKDGFSDKELIRIKARLETNLYAGIENILSKAQRLGRDNEFKGDPGYIVKEAALIKDVSREDIMRVYNKYIKGKNYVATSFVPKGKANLALAGAEVAKVWIEPVVQGLQNENVAPGEAAKFEKTKTKHDRSEPGFTEMPLFKMPAIWTNTLSNGMKVYGIQSNEVPLVNFEVVIKGGHWADPLEKSGVSSLLASLLMQGTATKTPAELEEAIDLLGATINVFSGNEELRIRATCLERNFESTLALVEEILLQPRWEEAEYSRLYKALQTGIKGREANATQVAAINVNRLIYGDKHILGYPVAGTKESIAGITLSDLKNYYHAYFSPSSSVIHVAGAVGDKRAISAFNSLGNNWKARPVNLPTYALPEQNKAGNLYFIDIPDSKQSVLYVAKLGVSAADPVATNISFANEVLGTGSSGRLTQVLRIGKGYTYGAGSQQLKQLERAPFMATTSVRANATLASLQIIRDMLKDYGTSFSDNEVAITKNKVLKGSTLTYERLGAKLSMLSDISKFNRSLHFIEEDQKKLVGLKLEDYKQVINTHLKEEDMIYVVVGDKATQLGEVKKLGKAKVIELDIYGNTIAD